MYQVLICIYNPTDDGLWDGSDFVFESKIDLLIISDWLCLSALIFCTVSAIRISVKSHIGTSLVAMSVYTQNHGNLINQLSDKGSSIIFSIFNL